VTLPFEMVLTLPILGGGPNSAGRTMLTSDSGGRR
jgi:hypothetical protein